MSQRLAAEFEHMGCDVNCNWSQVRTAFLKLGYVFEAEDIQRCIKYLLPTCELSKIPYHNFIGALKTSYQDMFASR